MRASMFEISTLYLIVAFGMVMFIGFGFMTFGSISYSADVVSQNLGHLRAVDAAHLVASCLEGGDGFITSQEMESFTKESCISIYPSLSGIDFEFRVEDLSDPGMSTESPGYDDSAYGISFSEELTSHSLFISIEGEGEVHAGRLYVQTS